MARLHIARITMADNKHQQCNETRSIGHSAQRTNPIYILGVRLRSRARSIMCIPFKSDVRASADDVK